jgi:hypothetical protein
MTVKYYSLVSCNECGAFFEAGFTIGQALTYGEILKRAKAAGWTRAKGAFTDYCPTHSALRSVIDVSEHKPGLP